MYAHITEHCQKTIKRTQHAQITISPIDRLTPNDNKMAVSKIVCDTNEIVAQKIINDTKHQCE